MTTLNQEFRDDLQQIISNYLTQAEAMEFTRYLMHTDTVDDKSLSHLSDADRSQLEFEITPARDRFHLDRTVTYAKKHLNTEAYLGLMSKLCELCVSHGMLNFAQELIAKIKRESKIKAVNANSMLLLSDIYAKKGKWEKSITTSRSAKKIYSDIEDKTGLAKCDNIIGTIYGEKGKLKKAGEYFESSLKLAEADKDKKLIAMLEINLGIINNINGNYDDAMNYFNGALRKLEELGDTRRIAELRHNIGMMYKEQNYYHSALQEFDTAISIAIRNEFHPILAISYISKAEILLNLEEYSFASAISDKAMEVAHLLDDKITIAEVYRLQGIIHKNLRNYRIAENNLMSALRINKKLDIQLNVAECYFELAQLFSETDNLVEEKEYLNQSLSMYKKLNSVSHIRKIETRLNELIN